MRAGDSRKGMGVTVGKTRRSEAEDRAAADHEFLGQIRGDQDGGSVAGPSGAQPVAVQDDGLRPTEMAHVPTAAPFPALGVSPILGHLGSSSPPPVGSFTAPPVGPPTPAYASQAFTPMPDPASTPAMSTKSSGSGVGPEPVYLGGTRQQSSVVEQDPTGLNQMYVSTLPRQQQYPSSGQQPLVSNGLDLPLLLGPTGIAPPGDLVTCPECGEMATVDAARRNSQDFCRKCDFPLFWARSTVILPSGEETGASLRRLPGTVGRAATAALMCPHCGEPNSPAAQTCVRCLLSLHPVEIVVAPVYFPPPEPELLPVAIGRDYPLWWILLVSGCLLAIVLIVVWIVVN